MAIKTYKPNINSERKKNNIVNPDIKGNAPLKSLTKSLKKNITFNWKTIECHNCGNINNIVLPDWAKNSSFIGVVGSGLKNGNQLSKEGKKRADKAILYSEKYPHLNIFLTGGQGIDETIPESLVLKEYFLKNGVPENKIFLEDKSKSTNENIKFMLKTLDSKNIKVKEILLVTSDFHMPRAVIIAKYYGLSPFPLASKTRRIAFIPNIMREELAYIKTYLFDLK